MASPEDCFTPNEYVRDWLKSVAAQTEKQQRHDHATSQTRNRKRSRSDLAHRQISPKGGHGLQEKVDSRHPLTTSCHRSPHAGRQSAPNEHKTRSNAGGREEKQAVETQSLAGAPIDASRKYARRPRHKTKPERYEYHDEQAKRSSRASNKRRTAHKKAGRTLNQEFKAPNVESNRLTLKQGAMPGFFAKGKASEPTIGRGIPDLTFSEMTFLSTKRQLNDARFRGFQVMTTKSKNKNSVLEISDYFADHHGENHNSLRSRNRLGSSSDGDMSNAMSEVRSAPFRPPPEHHSTARNGGDAQQLGLEPEPRLSGQELGAMDAFDRSRSRVISNDSATHSPRPSWSASLPQVPTHNYSGEKATDLLKNFVREAGQQYLWNKGAQTVEPATSVGNRTPLHPQDSASSPAPFRRLPRCGPSLVERYYYSLDDLKELAASGYPGECTGTAGAKSMGEINDVDTASGAHVDERRGLPAVHTITSRDTAQRPLLARADPKLMPPVQEQHYETNIHYLLRNELLPVMGYNDEQARPNSRSETEDARRLPYDLDLHELYAPAAETALLGKEERVEGELDLFDAALLQSVGALVPATCRVADAPVLAGEARADRWLAMEGAPKDTLEYFPADTDGTTFGPIAGPLKRGSGNQFWIQLLRPSQQGVDDSPPFSGFGRPFLLY